MPARLRIGLTLGDVAGVGPEVVAKALASGRLNPAFDYEVIGNPRTRQRADAIDWIVEAARRCRQGELAAMVTAPISKPLLRVRGWAHPGQTELLAELTGSRRFAMMLLGGPLRVALVTTHASLRQVPDLITRRRVQEVIELADALCRRLGLRRPQLGVAGLNPHAGEGGLFGHEDRRVIAPAVRACARRGIRVTGPVPADTLFHRAYRGEFAAVVAMYHDQGLAPLKMIAFDTGVNLTLGLPLIRTSPDHGTAFDIAGKGRARPDSMIAAINLAAQLARRSRRGSRGHSSSSH